MKRIFCIISLFALCLTFNQAHAQRCLPGMKGLQVTGGMADGVHWNSKNDFAYYFGAAYPYKDLQIPVSQFTGEGGYYLNFLSDRKKTFFLSLGLSALAGYETSNWGDKLLPDGSILTNKDGFVYGGALTLELESYITDRVVLLINARERCLFGSSVGKFHTQFGVGLKIIM